MLIATDYACKMSLDMRMVKWRMMTIPTTRLLHCAAKHCQILQPIQCKRDAVRFLIFKEHISPKEWNVYSKSNASSLEDHGLPNTEVRFIQEAKNDKQRKGAYQRNERREKIRVLFGSTSMLGTGVNAQKRAVAVHHLDTPWRPNDLAQKGWQSCS